MVYCVYRFERVLHVLYCITCNSLYLRNQWFHHNTPYTTPYITGHIHCNILTRPRGVIPLGGWVAIAGRQCVTNTLTLTSSGYMIKCEPYQGAATGNTIPELGMSGSVVVDMISELPRDITYHLYFDNLFTSLRLMDHLQKEGFGGTGTIRQNRIENAPFTDVKKFSKQARCTYEYIQDSESGTVLVRWHDNNVVTVASNCHGVLPTCQTKRWSNKEKKSIMVQQPLMNAAYNNIWVGWTGSIKM